MQVSRAVHSLHRFIVVSGMFVLLETPLLQSQPSADKPEAGHVRERLSLAINVLGWGPCMVLHSPSVSLEALGAPDLRCEEAKVVFMGPSGGRDLRLDDFGTAAAAGQALAQWHEFRLKQGFWKDVSQQDRPPMGGIADSRILVGDRASGAEAYATFGRYLIVATQRPDEDKAFGEAEERRVVALAVGYVRAVLQQWPEAQRSQTPDPTRGSPPQKSAGEPTVMGSPPAESKPATAGPASVFTPEGADEELQQARRRQAISSARAQVYAKAGQEDKAAFFRSDAAYWQHAVEQRLAQITAGTMREDTR